MSERSKLDPNFALAFARFLASGELDALLHQQGPTSARREKARSCREALKLATESPGRPSRLGFSYYYVRRDYEARAKTSLDREAEVAERAARS